MFILTANVYFLWNFFTVYLQLLDYFIRKNNTFELSLILHKHIWLIHADWLAYARHVYLCQRNTLMLILRWMLSFSLSLRPKTDAGEHWNEQSCLVSSESDNHKFKKQQLFWLSNCWGLPTLHWDAGRTVVWGDCFPHIISLSHNLVFSGSEIITG